jgi:hypothetical protein
MTQPMGLVYVECDYQQHWPDGSSVEAWVFLGGQEFVSTDTLRRVLAEGSREARDSLASAFYLADDLGKISDLDETLGQYMARRGIRGPILKLTLRPDVSAYN